MKVALIVLALAAAAVATPSVYGAPAYEASYKEKENYGQPKSYSGYDKKYDYDAPAYYYYNYKVKDDYSYVDFGAKEERKGDYTDGYYYVVLPDGRRQVVNYYVDGYSGYVADVKYEGEAKYADNYNKKEYNTYKKADYVSGPSYDNYKKKEYAPVSY